MQEGGDVNQINLATNVEIPEHDETFAELQTGRLFRAHEWIETGDVGAASRRTDVAVDADGSGEIGAVGRRSKTIVIFQDFHQNTGVNLRRVFDGQFAEITSNFRLQNTKKKKKIHGVNI